MISFSTTAKMESDLTHLNSVVKVDADGNKLNPIKLHSFDSNDIKEIGTRLTEIAEKMRTDGHLKEIVFSKNIFPKPNRSDHI
jgi:hypothetical protein